MPCRYLHNPPCGGHPYCSAMYFVVTYAYSGLSPVRVRPWLANQKRQVLLIKPAPAVLLTRSLIYSYLESSVKERHDLTAWAVIIDHEFSFILAGRIASRYLILRSPENSVIENVVLRDIRERGLCHCPRSRLALKPPKVYYLQRTRHKYITAIMASIFFPEKTRTLQNIFHVSVAAACGIRYD